MNKKAFISAIFVSTSAYADVDVNKNKSPETRIENKSDNESDSLAMKNSFLKLKNAVQFFGGLQSLKIDDSSQSSMTGYKLGLGLQSLIGTEWQVTPFIRAGVSYFSIGNTLRYKPLPGVTQDVVNDLDAIMLNADSGIQYEALPKLFVESSLGFNFGLSGKSVSAEKTSKFESKIEKNIASVKFASLSIAAKYQIISCLRVGLASSYNFSGSLKKEGSAQENVTGYDLQLRSEADFDCFGL